MCSRFYQRIWKGLVSKNYSSAFEAAWAGCPEALEDDEMRSMLKDFLTARAVEYTLKTGSSGGTGLFAASILLVESYKSGCRDMEALARLHCCGKDFSLKNMDAVAGCERSQLEFYRKRIPCSCLDEKHAAAKSQPKTAACISCRARKERNSFLLCSRCKKAQYCDRSCQIADWPRHKEHCKILATAGGER